MTDESELPLPSELVAETTEERRAPLDEQPEALAVAEEMGVLPDEDRRHEEPIAEPPSEEPADDLSPLIQDMIAADALVETLPAGSRVSWTAGLWSVYRGHGTSEHGQGKSLKRAIESIGAKYEFIDGTRVLVAENGVVLGAE